MPETTMNKGQRNGWKATTNYPMGETKDHFGRQADRLLHFSTYKDSRGGLTSNAMVCLSRDGMISFAIGGDFSKSILRTSARCTEKSIREQHAQALMQAEAILAEAHAFYDAKDQKAVRDVVAHDIEHGAAPALATNQTVRELSGEA